MDYRKHNQIDPWDDGVYGTGKTEPPKSNSGMVALLMIVIIFLSGIISVLSFLNIQLFHQLQEAQNQSDSIPMAFSEKESESAENILQEAIDDVEAVRISHLGLTGEYVSIFYQHYFSWPAGMLVTGIEETGKAEALGLEPGDILTQINGSPVTSQEDLDQILSSGITDPILLTIYRDGQEMTLNGN